MRVQGWGTTRALGKDGRNGNSGGAPLGGLISSAREFAALKWKVTNRVLHTEADLVGEGQKERADISWNVSLSPWLAPFLL